MENDLKKRTFDFAVTVLNLIETLPNTKSANIIGNQVGRSATSVAANYRSAQRGRSKREFIAKIGIAVEEADETIMWLEMLVAKRNSRF